MQNFTTITRKAIIIASPGNPGNFLRGVKRDIENMSRFLQSNKGGAWQSEDILILDNPNLAQVSLVLRSVSADYLFVYFSGHGYTDLRRGSRMLALRDYNIPDLHLLNSSPRQLVVVDACRSYSAPGLSGLPAFEDHIDHFEGSPAYELFNEYIACSPEGKLIVHSTQPGKVSIDSPSGGYFTQALLHVATRMKTEEDYLPCSIDRVLTHVPGVLRKNRNSQTPSIVHEEGNLTVPFALGSTQPLHKGKQKTGNGELAGALFLTLFMVGVAVAVTSN
ncbi:MAG: caspase family protein [Cytophagales bacterium]|nr:caspase family protein [Cytophagales bacterium]